MSSFHSIDWASVDSGSFDARAYYEKLSNQSLADLLKRENELLTGSFYQRTILLDLSHFILEIRELDSERQSLVYNHHHELIEASDTIKKVGSQCLCLTFRVQWLYIR